MRWNIDKLNEDSNAFEIADILGMNTNKCGSVTYVECVSGNHSETKINHCKLFQTGCHCFSCGATYNNFSMVKNYMENIEMRPASVNEICEILFDSIGETNKEEYADDAFCADNKEKFPLNKEDLKLLHICANPKRIKVVSSFDSEKERDMIFDGRSDGYVKYQNTPRIEIKNLYNDNRCFFWVLVLQKLEDAMSCNEEEINSLQAEDDPDLRALFLDSVSERIKLLELKEKVLKEVAIYFKSVRSITKELKDLYKNLQSTC